MSKVTNVGCRGCNYYLTGSKENQCLMAPYNHIRENLKIKQGLIGECEDFKPLPEQGK